MTTMVAELYDALRSAGAPDDQARAAATALTNYDPSSVKTELAALRAELKAEFAAIRAEFATKNEMKGLEIKVEGLRGELLVHRALLGIIVAGILSLVAKAFF